MELAKIRSAPIIKIIRESALCNCDDCEFGIRWALSGDHRAPCNEWEVIKGGKYMGFSEERARKLLKEILSTD